MQFNVYGERDAIFESQDAIRRDPGKLPIYEMLHVFYSTLVAGPLQKYGKLQIFFECFLSLAKYPDALDDIASLLSWIEKGKQELEEISTQNGPPKKN